jgi:hypothetical protein
VSFSNQDGSLTGNLDFDGAGNFLTALKPAIVSVNQAARLITISQPSTIETTTSLISSDSPSIVDGSVTFTADVHPGSGGAQPTGKVMFMSGSGSDQSLLGTGTLGSSSSCPGQVCAILTISSLPVGSNEVTAEYQGSSSFSGSTSNTVTQVVDKHTSAFSELTPSQAVSGSASTVNLTGVISASGPAYPPANEMVTVTIGNLSRSVAIGAYGAFSFGDVPTGSLEAGQYYAITYSYAGDTRFAGADDKSTTLLVKWQPVFSALTPSQTINAGTGSISLKGTLTAPVPLPNGAGILISIAGKSKAALVLSNGAFTAQFDTSTIPASSNPYFITYSFAGSEPFQSSAKDSSTSLTVTGPADTTTTITASVRSCVVGAPFQLFITVQPTPPATGVPSGQVTLTRLNPDNTTTTIGTQFLDSSGRWSPDLNSSSNFPMPVGTSTFKATYQGASAFNPSSGTLSLTCAGQ